MEIILLERVENLGQMGDLVTVKPGYARNFLLPKGKAVRATAQNLEKFNADRAQLEAENLAKKSEAEKVAKKMEGLSVNLIRAASEMGQLYGSASGRDIANAATEAGFSINKTQVDINTAVKTLGIYPVRVILHPEVSVEIKINIARSKDEAAEQLRLGRAIISDTAEREREEAAEAAAKAETRMAEQESEEDTANPTSEAAGDEASAKDAATEDTATDDAVADVEKTSKDTVAEDAAADAEKTSEDDA